MFVIFICGHFPTGHSEIATFSRHSERQRRISLLYRNAKYAARNFLRAPNLNQKLFF